MPRPATKKNLFAVNFITGMSNGLVLPFASCVIAYPFSPGQQEQVFLVGLFIAIVGGLVFGFARYFGEQEEIHHNHPDLVLGDAEKELALMQRIGIDAELTADIEAQMKQERLQWLQEVKEHGMGWERANASRAIRSGLQVAIGFVSGGLLVVFPFCFVQDRGNYLLVPASVFLLLMLGFGCIKAIFLNVPLIKSALSKLIMGILVLFLAVLIALFVSKTTIVKNQIECSQAINPLSTN